MEWGWGGGGDRGDRGDWAWVGPGSPQSEGCQAGFRCGCRAGTALTWSRGCCCADAAARSAVRTSIAVPIRVVVQTTKKRGQKRRKELKTKHASSCLGSWPCDGDQRVRQLGRDPEEERLAHRPQQLPRQVVRLHPRGKILNRARPKAILSFQNLGMNTAEFTLLALGQCAVTIICQWGGVQHEPQWISHVTQQIFITHSLQLYLLSPRPTCQYPLRI